VTFYNYIENARYEMFRLVNGWTREGAETKARISESLDNARIEYMQKESENAKLRELLHDAAIELYVNGNITDGATELLFDQMRELGIEVPHD
jgi:hypothetical protein